MKTHSAIPRNTYDIMIAGSHTNGIQCFIRLQTTNTLYHTPGPSHTLQSKLSISESCIPKNPYICVVVSNISSTLNQMTYYKLDIQLVFQSPNQHINSQRD